MSRPECYHGPRLDIDNIPTILDQGARHKTQYPERIFEALFFGTHPSPRTQRSPSCFDNLFANPTPTKGLSSRPSTVFTIIVLFLTLPCRRPKHPQVVVNQYLQCNL